MPTSLRAEMSNKKYHYTYYSYEEWGMGYFGSRSCDCLPEEDINYFGSFRDKNFHPTQKIILKDDYQTREEAIVDEIILHQFYEVGKNPHFANRAKQTSKKFIFYDMVGEKNPFYGKTHTEETKKILEKKSKETWKKQPHPWIGKSHTEETKNILRNKNKNQIPWNKGIPRTEEEKMKMWMSHKEWHKNNVVWNKGKTGIFSQEALQSMSEKRKGVVPWNKGIPRTPEEKKNMSENHPMNNPMKKEECIQKMIEGLCKTTYEFIDPEGNIHITKNMTQYCLDQNLNRNCIALVIKGKQKHHKNWTCKVIGKPEL